MLSNIFASAQAIPHGFCLSWDPALMALHVVSDALTGVAYFSIPLALAVFVTRRADLAFRGVFWLFVLFILACGSTHFFSIWTLWHPDYAAEGVVKAITAITSLLTAVQLWHLLPRALALPSPAALRGTNALLQEQIREREAAVIALRQETAERQRAEDMLRQAQKMEAIGHLTGGVAHDFNNLLTIVVANLELLDRRLSAEPALRKYVSRAMSGATRGAVMTQQLLAFARRQPLRPAVFDLGAQVNGLAVLLRGTLGSAIALELDLGEGLWLAEADPNQLESALLNLAINARDAMPRGGSLRVKAANVTLTADALTGSECEPGEYVCLSVADSGFGMSPEVLRSAFDPFFTTKPVGQGSGLGLSQVYGFIKQSQGHITLQSAPGQGTTVSLYLRRTAAANVAGSVGAVSLNSE